MPMDGQKVARRSFFRTAALAAGIGAAGAALTGCAGRAAKVGTSARPTLATGEIVLHFAPNWQGASWNSTASSLNQDFIDQNYNARTPGVRVQVAGHVQAQADAQIAASLSGSGYMDVFQDCCDDLVTWENAGLLLPLDSYLQRDNVNVGIWPPRHLEVLTFDGSIHALPAYDGPVTVFYRQDILDSLGLEYPGPDWTYDQAAQIWSACAGTVNGQRRYGASLFFTPSYSQASWWMHGWGAAEMDPTGTVSGMDSAGAVACMSWVQNLARNQVVMPRGGMSLLQTGQCVFKQSGGWELLPAAQLLGSTVKWDVLPNPAWPAGPSTYNNIDFYAINAVSKHHEAAWQFLRWVCADPAYPRFQIKTTLVGPSLLSLWSEWEANVKSAAPPLANKQLHWLGDAESGGYAWPTIFFKYNATQADNLIDTWWGKVWALQATPPLAMQQLSQLITALEQAGGDMQAAAAAAAGRFPSQGPPIAKVTPGL